MTVRQERLNEVMDMEAVEVIEDNYRAVEGSFLEQLHEYNHFDLRAFEVLCEAIAVLGMIDKEDHQIASEMVFIWTQTLLHIIYHFDPKDLSRINDLPENYNEYIARLEQLVMQYWGPAEKARKEGACVYND